VPKTSRQITSTILGFSRKTRFPNTFRFSNSANAMISWTFNFLFTVLCQHLTTVLLLQRIKCA